jgi:two-component system sensor histidine kinase KdpD
MSSPDKPSPDELLVHLLQDEENARRGRLKVFLGYASGVGKSFRMFDEGRRRRDRGQDVIVGAIQPHNSPELASLLQQLEILPMRQVDGVPVIDTDRILQRQPKVCLVDGLAHDNPTGSRNAHRWQDVEQLLAAGISVITTINLEFVAERQKQVSAIRGKRASTSVPEAFLHKAEEVVVVDAPADYHVNWLKESYVNAPLADKEAKLSQLREIALLLAADVVDSQLEVYLRRQGIGTSWGTQERFLVCLTSKSPVHRMVQRARLAQQRFHGALFAMHVRKHPLDPDQEAALERNLQIARDAEADVVVLDGEDEVCTIIEFARKERITQLFLGHSPVRRWQRWFCRTTADRIIGAAEGIDVKLFPQ